MTPVAGNSPKRLVLVGGGHAHVAVLKALGFHPLPGVQITLVSKTAMTPYSGMLPGHIAGHYRFEQMHIDLRPLCQFAGTKFLEAGVTGLNLAKREVSCDAHPPVPFDLLSLDIGSTPPMHNVPGAAQYALAIKPVERFLGELERLQKQVLAAASPSIRIVVVGGGAGGVEVLLAVRHRFLSLLPGRDASRLQFHLVTDSSTILPTHNARVQKIFTRVLAERDVRVHLNHRVAEVQANQLVCKPGDVVPFEALIWITGASAPAWIRESGLQTDPHGFIALNDGLQSPSHPCVFAAGDIAAVINHPRPKSGVFAVRQGPPLARNLRRALAGQPPEPFTPQKEFLSLISTGDRYAVGSRGNWAFEGKWVWRFKDWIDAGWMRQYQIRSQPTS